MKTRHPKYKLKQGDTITSLTQHFDVDQKVWLQYHNNMCRLDEVILNNTIPKHLKDIYLLPELWDKENRLNLASDSSTTSANQIKPIKEVMFGYNNTLYIKRKRVSKKYGVEISISNNSKTNTIKYEVSLSWSTDDEDQHFVNIEKVSPTFINNSIPELMLDRLAEDIMNSIYPVVFGLNSQGEIRDIQNLDEIRNRWQQYSEKLRQNKQGDIFEKYIRLTDLTISNKSVFLENIHTNLFIFTYFIGINQSYGNQNFEIDRIVSFPFQQGVKPYEYAVKQKVSKFLDEYGSIPVTLSGELKDERTATDFKYKLSTPYHLNENEKPMQGSLKGLYFIDSEDYRIKSYRISFSLDTDQKKVITVNATVLK